MAKTARVLSVVVVACATAGFQLAAIAGAAGRPTALEMVERAGAGPSLLFTDEMLPSIREKARTDRFAREMLRRLADEVEPLLENRPAVPDRGGQWPLWMTCSDCGSPLESRSPTLHVCRKCGKGHSGWPYDDCYVSEVHEKLSQLARDCGILWRITGDRRYAKCAGEILLEYAEAYGGYAWHGRNGPTPGPGGDAARAFAQVLDEAVWLIPILEGYDAVRDTLAEGQRRKIECGLVRESANTIQTENARWSNHEVWHLAAYGLAAVVLRDAALLDKSLHSEFGAENQLRHGVLPDGMWYEGSLHYHYYTTAAFLPYFRSLKHLGYAVPDLYKKMFVAPMGQLTPDGTRPPINDAWSAGFKPGDMPEYYELAHSWWTDEAINWWVSCGSRVSREYLLWGVPTWQAQNMRPLESTVYESSGLAVLRSSTREACGAVVPDNCVMVDYGPHGEYHGHPDKLNLMVWLRGRLVSEDPGCIGYGNPRHWGWYKSSLAHNVLRVDNGNQLPCTGELLAFSQTNGASAVAVYVPGDRKKSRWDGPMYEGVDVLRATALCDGMVFDYMAAESEAVHEYEYCFHVRGSFEAPYEFAPCVNLPKRFASGDYKPDDLPGNESWAWVDDPRESKVGSSWHGTWKQADNAVYIFQQGNAGGVLRTGKGSAQPPSEKMELAVKSVHGRKAVFATLIGCGEAPEVRFSEMISEKDGTCGMRVAVNGKSYSLTVNRINRTACIDVGE